MNETLQNALAEIITSALQNAEAAKEFVLAEMPEVIQQLLIWKAVASLICMFASAAVLYGIYRYWKWYRKTDWPSGPYMSGGEIAAVWIGGICTAIGGFMAMDGLTQFVWLQIWLAPKVYLIEYAAELVK